jgi:hypothetical protein
MPPPEKQISPEEKLLKVIQGADQGKPAAASGEEKLLKVVQGGSKVDPVPAKPSAAPRAATAEPRAKEPSPVAKQDPATKARPAPKIEKADTKGETKKVAEEAEKPGAKPKLKVAKVEEPVIESSAPAPEPSKTDEKPKSQATATGLVKKSTRRKFSVRAVNSWLAATVLVTISLSAYEMWAASRDTPPIPRPAVVPVLGTKEPVNAPPSDSVPKFLVSLNNKDMFQWNKGGVVSPGITNQPTADWIKYAKENLKLKAFMGSAAKGTREAIVTDKGKENKMSFLKVGQKFTVGSLDVIVKELQNDQVILFDGVQEQAIK